MSDNEFDTSRYNDRRPRVTRTNSLLFGYSFQGSNTTTRRASGGTFGSTPSASPAARPAGSSTPELPGWYTSFFGAAPSDPLGFGSTPASASASSESGRRSFGRSFDTSPYRQALQSTITADGQTVIEGPPADEASAGIYAPLGDLDPNAKFLFDRGAPINPETGKRTGVLESRGVYGSADSLERRLEPGQTNQTGSNENIMTIAAGVQWLRNLAARDRTAYNKLVVLLRNAGYPGLSANDAELPLNGYSQAVGSAFALAANDLANAGQGGDNRTLLEYLTDRGQGYADYLAQEQADQAAAEAYKPVERSYQDPAAVRAAAKDAAIEALGRKLTPEEEARFEAAFRSRENAFYDALDTAREGETKFAEYEPNLAGQIDDFIGGDEFATERAANAIGEYSQTFLRMMGVGT